MTRRAAPSRPGVLWAAALMVINLPPPATVVTTGW